MIDLIELLAGILEAWYLRRILAALGAMSLLYFGVPLLVNLPASEDFYGDLAVGLVCITFAGLLVVWVFRTRKGKS